MITLSRVLVLAMAAGLAACSQGASQTFQPYPSAVTVSVTVTPQPSASLEDALRASTPSVGRIISLNCDGLPKAGTGFLVGEDLVLTAAHVVRGASAITIELPDEEAFDLELLHQDPNEDAALLRLTRSVDAEPLKLAGTPASVGQRVGVVGYPLGLSAVHVNAGIVSSVDDDAVIEGYSIRHLLTLDAAVNPGNSGGPVVDERHEILGLISASALSGRTEGDTAEGIHFAIPADRLSPILAEWSDAPSEPLPQCEEEGEEVEDAPTLELLVRGGGDQAEMLGGALWVHGQAINEGNYEAAWEMFTPKMKTRMGNREDWSAGLDTSFWIVLEIRSATIDGDRGTVVSFLRTHQSAERGPSGDTCSIWPITYSMVRSGDAWLIDKATRRAQPKACA